MVDRPNRVGQQLGNYRLISLLGQGGFAEVYLGEHIHLGTQAAVKVLHTQLTNEHVEAFRSEARTIAHLIHPNIVRVLEFGVEDGIPFLVMDYAPNGTLRKLHPKGSSLATATIVTYVKQIADALQYAHDEKLIHRDIKPENMLVGRRHEVLLSDFGIALVAQSSRYQSTQDVIGTVVYMSPEQIQGKPRPASDQYALGIVVYEWLCGDRPFHGSFTELCAQHMFAPPPPLREKVPMVSSDVEHVVMTALAKDPHQRFASVQAFATALEQASRSAQSQPLAPTIVAPSAPLPPTVVATPPSPPARRPMTVTPPNVLSTPRQTDQPAPHQPFMPPLVLSHRRGTTLSTYRVHSKCVNAVAWSPDGCRVAFASSDRTVQVREIGSDKGLLTYRGHSDAVLAVTWSPDSRRVASASEDNTVQVWDTSSGLRLLTYCGHSWFVKAVTWSPDSRRVASASEDSTVQVWDASSGLHLLTCHGHPKSVNAIAWSPDGKCIASGSIDGTVQVWDATNGGHVFTCCGHSAGVSTVAWSPNGRRIASGSHDKTVQVWDATNRSHVYTYQGHSFDVYAVAWSPNGQRIASAGDTTVQVWDAVDGSHVFTYKGHDSWVNAVAWSPDGKYIASGSGDKTVQVWVAS